MSHDRHRLEQAFQRVLHRDRHQQELLMTIDDHQHRLTEQHIVPALPLLEDEFTDIRREVDASIHADLAHHPTEALTVDPSKYPKGYCLPITHRCLELFRNRNVQGSPSEAFLAVLRFGEAGGHVGRIWGVLRDQYFQNAIQFGSYYFDVANDTVDVRKPKIEHMPLQDSGFRQVTSIADFASIGERYWGCRFFANLHFPRLAATSPLLQWKEHDGELRVFRLFPVLQWMNWRSDFQMAQDYLQEASRQHPMLPEELRSAINGFRSTRLKNAEAVPDGGMNLAAIEQACADARSLYRNHPDGESAHEQWVRSTRHIPIIGG